MKRGKVCRGYATRRVEKKGQQSGECGKSQKAICSATGGGEREKNGRCLGQEVKESTKVCPPKQDLENGLEDQEAVKGVHGRKGEASARIAQSYLTNNKGGKY